MLTGFELVLNAGVTLKKGEDTRYSLHPLDKKSEMKWKVALRETIEDAKAQVRFCRACRTVFDCLWP